MPVGRIKKLNSEKGFGFIVPDDEGPDIYFHCSSVPGAGFALLNVEHEVQYELEPQPENADPRKRRAASVQRYFGGQVLAQIGDGSIAPLRRHPKSRGKKPNWRGGKDV